jgi:hypothetical protein
MILPILIDLKIKDFEADICRSSITIYGYSRLVSASRHGADETRVIRRRPCARSPSIASEGRVTDSGINGRRPKTGTEYLIPCPRDQEILTSNWDGNGCRLRSVPLTLDPPSGRACNGKTNPRKISDLIGTRGVWIHCSWWIQGLIRGHVCN